MGLMDDVWAWVRAVLGIEGPYGEWIASHYMVAIQKIPKKKRSQTMREVWGVVVHTTGSGVLTRAQERGSTPIKVAVDYYLKTAGPHYVIDYDGTIYQIQGDNLRGAHVGVSRAERKKYLSGEWRGDFREEALWHWDQKWKPRKSPQHLYPTKSPNQCYVGIEMVPIARKDRLDDGLWFTPAQHRSAAAIACDLARRYGWPDKWWETPRLVAHEDIDAYGRWDRHGGWDPGALRTLHRFDWNLVCVEIERRST